MKDEHINDPQVIDLTEEAEIKEKKDWRDFPNRERVAAVITLTEGDVLVKTDGTYHHVASGEITVFADSLIDESAGELAEIAIEGVQDAIREGKEIFNMEDVS
jgi:hypothetical protein